MKFKEQNALTDNQEADPLPIRSFILRDVQALYGGRVLWASEDRVAFVQTVAPGMRETRYRFSLTIDQWGEIERLVGKHHLFTLSIAGRPGVPDETLQTITVTRQSGESISVQKWASDKNSDFDAVYHGLLGMCRTDGEHLYEGPFDWDWRPDGFT
jgi:hypothetical protein